MNKSLLIIFLMVISISSVSASISDYYDEFNNSGETCSLVDTFTYKEYRDEFINYYKETVPAIIQCCSDDSCHNIIFNSKNEELLFDSSVMEIINLNYIRYQIGLGNLTKTYFISASLDSCALHGRDTLTQESANLVANGAEEIAKLKKTKQTKQVVSAIKTARTLEIISPFSIVDFSLGYACKYQDKKLEKAVETLAECNLYLSNIEYNYAQTGYVNALSLCFKRASEELYEYTDNNLVKTKCGVDWTLNAGKEVWNFLSMKKTALEDKWTPEQTECALAKSIIEEIKDKQILFNHPYQEAIYTKYVTRVNQKSSDYNKIRREVVSQLEELDNLTPSWINIVSSRIFLTPDNKLLEDKENITRLKNELDSCDELFLSLKFNSAISCAQKLPSNILEISDSVTEKKEIEQSIKWLSWLILVLLVFLLVKGFILLKKKLEEEY